MPSLAQFVARRKDRWAELEQLLKLSEGNGLRRLTPDQLDALGSSYREVASDLAIANRDFPHDQLTASLNALTARAHMQLYRAPSSSLKRLLHFFTVGFAQRFRAAGRYVVVSALLLFVPAVFGYLAGWLDPTLRDALVPAELRALMSRGRTWTEIEAGMRPAMAAVIFTNNIRVSFLAFGGGAAFGLGTLFVLVSNGLSIAAVLGAAQHYGVIHLLGEFITAHGYIEIMCIIIAGAGGLMIGDGLLRPGLLRRRDSATRASRKALELLMGTTPIFVLAGLVEGFISPSELPAAFKYALGPVLWIVMMVLLLTLGRPGGWRPGLPRFVRVASAR